MKTLRTALAPLIFLVTTIGLHANESENGLIDVYSSQSQGRPTATGELYNPNDFTAAHGSLPFGSRVRVANFESGKMVDVRINDRKGNDGRLLRLSHAAGSHLGIPTNRAVRGSLMVVGGAPPTAVRRAPAQPPAARAPVASTSGVPAVPQGYSIPPLAQEKRGLFQKKKTQYGIPSSQYEPYVQPNSAPASKEGFFSGLFNGKQKQAAGSHVYAQNSIPVATGANQVIPMSSNGAAIQGVNGAIPGPANRSPGQTQRTVAQPRPVAYRPAAQAPVAQPPAPQAPYKVQFGAFRRTENAQELSGMLSGAGIGTSVVQSKVNALNLVISSGGFRTAEEAQQWIDYEGARRGWQDRPVVIR